MQQGESIAGVQKRFTHIVNHLIRLGKQFDKEELNIKILKCLDKSWQPKVTAISENKDLTILTTTTLLESWENMNWKWWGWKRWNLLRRKLEASHSNQRLLKLKPMRTAQKKIVILRTSVCWQRNSRNSSSWRAGQSISNLKGILENLIQVQIS